MRTTTTTTTTTKGLRAAVFGVSARFHRLSRRVAGPGKRHSARGTPRAQPRDVRSAGRDTWNLTGEALGGPQKRLWAVETKRKNTKKGPQTSTKKDI